MAIRLAALILVAGILQAPPASASSITWEFSGTANGTLFRAPDLAPVDITDVPFVVDVTLDTAAPNGCGANSSSGVYLASSASLAFLGFEYPGGAGVETNSTFTLCVPQSGGGTLFRILNLSSDSAIQTEPGGTLISWETITNPSIGDFAFFVPDPTTPGALPTELPFQPFPIEGLFLESLPGPQTEPLLTLSDVEATVTPGPEPATLTLLGAGLAVAAARRRRR